MNQTKQQTQKAPKIKVGSIVSWTSRGRYGTTAHNGTVVKLYENRRGVKFAEVQNGDKIYTPYLARLSLAK